MTGPAFVLADAGLLRFPFPCVFAILSGDKQRRMWYNKVGKQTEGGISVAIMRFPGGLRKAVTLSYDDGVEQDRELIGILDQAGLKCTFNLNSGCFPPEGHACCAEHHG